MWNDGWMWINICIGSIISICVSVYSIQLQYWAIEYTCIFFFQKISPIVKYKNFVSFDFSFCSLQFSIFPFSPIYFYVIWLKWFCVCVCVYACSTDKMKNWNSNSNKKGFKHKQQQKKQTIWISSCCCWWLYTFHTIFYYHFAV